METNGSEERENFHKMRNQAITEKAAPFFREEAFARIVNAYLTDGTVWRALPGALALRAFAVYRGCLQISLLSVENFLAMTAFVFSREFVDSFRRRCQAFDDLCGGNVTDAFMAEGTLKEWVLHIADGIMESCSKLVDRKRLSDESSRAGVEACAEKQNPHSDDPHREPAQPDGTDERPRPVDITQIHLKGKTLTDAWSSNPKIAQLAELEWLGLSGWEPSKTPGIPVFHGSAGHFVHPSLLEDLSAAPPALRRHSGGMTSFYPAPGMRDYRGIHTSFSALRAFLWAAFRAEVIVDDLSLTRPPKLREAFRFRGQPFRGVLLLEFYPHQPAPPALSWYQVPEEKEKAWHDAVKLWSGWAAGNIWTDRLKEYHGLDTPDFPDLIHGRELPRTRQALSSFDCNKSLLWQTTWMSESAERILNKRMTHIYAVSFDPEPELEPEPEGKRNSPKNFGHLKGALSRKLARNRDG